MTQDAELQPIFCRWATEKYQVPVAEVHFVVKEPHQWSEITFEDGSITVTLTLDDGSTVTHIEDYDASFLAELLP